MTQASRPQDSIATDPEEWAALMVLAQSGDSDAYRTLLIGITPYLSSTFRILGGVAEGVRKPLQESGGDLDDLDV